MYAVVKTGGHQFHVEKDAVIKVPRLNMNVGDTVELEDVLMLSSEAGVTYGTPVVDGAKVIVEVVAEARDKKVIVFKMKRRKKFRRKNGHRQWFTELRVKDIVAP